MSVKREQLIQKAPWLWEIPPRKNMQVPARIFALEPMIEQILADRAIDQLMNVASLPGIVTASMVMPDVHEGYGFPIGGIAATRYPHGAISPGGIGYDINCGVRLLRSTLHYNQVRAQLDELCKSLYTEIPSGVGKGGRIKLSTKEINQVLQTGAQWAVNKGMGSSKELNYIESHGCLTSADPDKVSEFAKQRGDDQLGTIGAGNHFVEVDEVSDIYHPEAAQAFGLKKGQVVVLIHTGSRGLGHQVATDYIRIMMKAMPAYGIQVPDRELACVPFSSPEGQDYYQAMCAAANFAWCNREVITWEVREAFRKIFGKKAANLSLVYDVAHNIAKIEQHLLDGQLAEVIVHRKGATRAFGPHYPELPMEYQAVGQPVMIPGSMGTESYVLVGTAESYQLSFGSTCHGAGRRLSRTAAKKQVDAPALKSQLLSKGIHLEAGSFKGMAEEAPIAYKDVNMVVETVHQAGIAHKVARLRPLAVIKG